MAEGLPSDIDPRTTASASLILFAHTMGVLVKQKRITTAELDEIFAKAMKPYTSPLMPPPTEEWQRRIPNVLMAVRNNALQSALED